MLRRKGQVYCRTRCSQVALARKKRYTGSYGISLSRGTRGAVSELRVAVDLLERGYEVFRAVSQACSSDLIALSSGQILRIEVRTGARYSPTGSLSFPRNGTGNDKRSEECLDHYAVVVHGEPVIYIPELPGTRGGDSA
mgnify:CR=1 FL=1